MTVRIIYYFFSYFFVSLIFSMVLVSLMQPLSFKVGAVDRGSDRRIHKGIIPRLGGVGIFVAFLMPIVFFLTRGEWGEFNDKMVGILIASVLVFFMGVYDDIRGAKIGAKLFVEGLAAVIIYTWGISITEITNPLGGSINLGWMSLPLTVLWIVVITNAINLIDGIDGLAAGTCVFVAATLFFLTDAADIRMRLTFVIFVGSLIGFLRFNFPPASIFMGDCGSLFIGFFLASLSIVSAHKATAMATMMVPVIVFSLPIVDMLYAILRRYYRGIPLGEADREHIHHKLLEKGFSKKKVLVLLYLLNIGVMLSILLIVRKQLNIDLIGFLLFAVIVITGTRILGYIKFIPTIREMMANYDIRRKSRYFSYIIKKFKYNASGSGSFDDFRSHLSALMREYNYNAVEIVLDLPGIGNPFFYFKDEAVSVNPTLLSFPIIYKGNCLGKASISTEVGRSSLLCVSEMIDALSGEIGKFVERNKN